ncbi:MAG: hypothetical protein HY582_05240 [Candidatus Omnitrophica bacterium]|nr:hypothetical protein [Candidatus Omnitrophota bacterium]
MLHHSLRRSVGKVETAWVYEAWFSLQSGVNGAKVPVRTEETLPQRVRLHSALAVRQE